MPAAARDLMMLHDHDLEALSSPEAVAILAARGRGASLVRLTLARMYGMPGMAAASGWHVVPHVTCEGTIGVVDVAAGAAWDSGIEAGEDVAALGLDDAHTPEANHPSLAGDVRFDGELVQRRGETPGQPITAPPGWRRIGLPTWRGYDGDGRALVPADLYEPEDTWLRPMLVAVGLMTCYGDRRAPRRTLGRGTTRPWLAPHEKYPDPDWWPMTDEQRRELRAVPARWLEAAVDRLVAIAGLPEDSAAVRAWRGPEGEQADVVYAFRGPGPAPHVERHVYDAINALRTPWDAARPPWGTAADLLLSATTRHAAASPIVAALADAGIARVAHYAGESAGVVGARRLDLIAALLERAVTLRLHGVAEALAEGVYTLADDGDVHGPQREALRLHLAGAAGRVAAHLLRPLASEAAEMPGRIVAAYYDLIGPAPVPIGEPARDAAPA